MQQEVKSIIAKRRDFEYTFIKRAAAPEDYLRALEYELTLEALRRKRRERLGLQKTSLSDHAGIRRIHFVFDRACRKFRGDIQWWMQWLDFALRTNSAKAVGKILARALQLHPRSEELWLQAAEFEFDRQRNVTAARALLLRSLRINRHSSRLWLAYFRVECLYILLVRGRRVVLGLDAGRSFRTITGATDAAQPALLSAAMVQAGAGTVESSRAGETVDYDVDIDAESVSHSAVGAPGAQDVGHSSSTASASNGPTTIAGIADAAAEAGIPAAPDARDTTPSVSLASFLANADARDAFFSGSVPRIVYTQAIRTNPADLHLREQFLQAADSFIDAFAESSLPSGPPAPAFPLLTAFILDSIAQDFGTHPRAWAILAHRPAAGLQAAANARAASRTVDSDGVGVAVETFADEDLFLLDKSASATGSGQAEEGAGKGKGSKGKKRSRPDGANEDAADMIETGFDGRGLPSLPSGLMSLPSFTSWLSSGACDAALLAGVPSHEWMMKAKAGSAGSNVEETAGLLIPRLPPFEPALWVAGFPTAAVPALAGKKKAKATAAAAASAAVDSSPTSCTLHAPSAVSPLPDYDGALESWASSAQSDGIALLQEALEGAGEEKRGGRAGGVSTALGLQAAMAALYVELLTLPLCPSVARTQRMFDTLHALAQACVSAIDGEKKVDQKGVHPAGSDAELMVLHLGLLCVQALLRSGQIASALDFLPGLIDMMPHNPWPALVYARLMHMLQALPPSSVAMAGDSSSEGVPPACSSSYSISLTQLGAGVQRVKSAGHGHGQGQVSQLLLTALHRTPVKPTEKAVDSGAGALWIALCHSELSAVSSAVGRDGPLGAAVAVVRRLGLAGLPAEVDMYVRIACIDMIAAAPGAQPEHICSAAGPGTPPTVQVHALRSSMGAWRSAGRPHGAVLQQLRKAAESACAQHGKHSAVVWLAYLTVEREASSAPNGSMPMPMPSGTALVNAATVYQRATMALQGQAAAEFVQQAASA